MEKNVVLVDYGLGNLFSISQAFKKTGVTPVISSDIRDLLQATHIVLPGVGAFGDAMTNLKQLGLISPLLEKVSSGTPLLGVCLGMQLLFEASEEYGVHQGLGLIKGGIKRFPNEIDSKKLRVPNIGWLGIEHADNEKSLKGIPSGEFMYFVHSYYTTPDDSEDVLTTTVYQGFEYCSSVSKNNIVGFQFHPEKSGQSGLKLYDNFINNF
ncbi:imidazole glycerol phosphate synthase subunit HisH [Pontibacter sp. E15-1]|uniref:imidazole glycerol phosphate synthase subunit HisH n=1 Tax=Pontibacter sp. E15-1 TaxID=2919918 RepID=UPI001F4FCF0A|nr:imidazole glycerol phosphate synthase subunit HisH [Pontibacter sp. E15-1]MCJ8166420.1 imidazole glycerol phosphate synthase subunit HisH [Pontibacter sp. E15-1]